MRELIPYFQDVLRILRSIDPTCWLIAGPKVTVSESQQGHISFAIRYSDGSTLYVNLQANCAGDPIVWGDYGFQYLESGGSVRFRFDNAPHHNDLPNSPHHLHLASGEF